MDPAHKTRDEYQESGFKCRRSPNPAEWQAIKPIFTELYHFQGMTLRQVMEVMKKDYNFHATVKMYKNKIALWRLAKYTKHRDFPRLLKTKKRANSDRQTRNILRRGALYDSAALDPTRCQAEQRGHLVEDEEHAEVDADVINVRPNECISPYSMAGEPEVFSLMQKLMFYSQTCRERRINMDPSVSQCSDTSISLRNSTWLTALQAGFYHMVRGEFIRGGLYTRHGCSLFSSMFTADINRKVYIEFEQLSILLTTWHRNGFHHLGNRVLRYMSEILKLRCAANDSLSLALDALLRLLERRDRIPLAELIRSVSRQSLPKLLPPTHKELLWLFYQSSFESSSFSPLDWTQSIRTSCGAQDYRFYHAVNWCSTTAHNNGDWVMSAALWSQYFGALNDYDGSPETRSAQMLFRDAGGYFRLACAQMRYGDCDSWGPSLQKACAMYLLSGYTVSKLHDRLCRLPDLLSWLYSQPSLDQSIQHVQFVLQEYETYLIELDQRRNAANHDEFGSYPQ